jgi:lysophospholipase L1-like esterase
MLLLLTIMMMGQGLISPMINQQVKKKKYLALGDSYTIGESVDISERFPIQLTESLKSEGVELDDPEIIAKTGWTTDELMAGINQADLGSDYDLVTLLIGVNNQYRGRDIENYTSEFTQLLEQSIEFAGGNKERVIVVSIPDYGVTPFGQKKGRKRIAKEIDAFNSTNKAICKRFGVKWIDVTQISRTALKNRQLVAEDGLHPSGKMYALWVREILPVALKILN